jgi:hypothetical protein
MTRTQTPGEYIKHSIQWLERKGKIANKHASLYKRGVRLHALIIHTQIDKDNNKECEPRKLCVDSARMQAVAGEVGGERYPVREFKGKHCICKLGLPVRHPWLVAPRFIVGVRKVDVSE